MSSSPSSSSSSSTSSRNPNPPETEDAKSKTIPTSNVRLCTGYKEQGCRFHLNGTGQPATVVPPARLCILCCPERFVSTWQSRGGALITRHFLRYTDALTQSGLALVETHSGEDVRKQVEERIARAKHRRNPDRPRRGPRGRGRGRLANESKPRSSCNLWLC